jgi:hypothetical protein
VLAAARYQGRRLAEVTPRLMGLEPEPDELAALSRQA